MNIHALLEEFILLKFSRIPALAKRLDSLCFINASHKLLNSVDMNLLGTIRMDIIKFHKK